MKYTYIVNEKDDSKRVVDVLRYSAGMSGLMTKRIRLYGNMTINGLSSRMIDIVNAGDEISVTYNDGVNEEPVIVDGRAGVEVLYSDKYIIVVNKPAGMVIHPTSNHQSGTLTDHFSELQLHPASRLDRETSGIVLIGRDPHVHHTLALQQKSSQIEKVYLAINHGIFNPLEGIIDSPIMRRENTIMLRRVHPEGSTAKTRYRTLAEFRVTETSLMEFIIDTGRTHQIRVHSLYSGHPIIGDGLYGSSSNENAHYQRSGKFDDEINRQALHSFKISFNHPYSGERMKFIAPIPEDMLDLLKAIKIQESIKKA